MCIVVLVRRPFCGDVCEVMGFSNSISRRVVGALHRSVERRRDLVTSDRRRVCPKGVGTGQVSDWWSGLGVYEPVL